MRSNCSKAFTLIEIMLVVIIIGVLAAMVVPNLSSRAEEAKRTAAHTDIEANLSTALDLYQLDAGRYPTTEQGLQSLLEAPRLAPLPVRWQGPYLKKKRMPRDPWTRDYVYRCPGIHNPDDYDLSSLGRDGMENEDDVTNWESVPAKP